MLYRMHEATIQLALADFQNGSFTSLRQAAKAYRVHHQRLSDRVKDKIIKQQACVSQQLLSPLQEEILVQ